MSGDDFTWLALSDKLFKTYNKKMFTVIYSRKKMKYISEAGSAQSFVLFFDEICSHTEC